MVEAVAPVLHPTRLRVLEALSEPATAAAVGRRLGLPRQQVAYHLKALSRDGLVQTVAERRKGNVVERLVRATGRAYLVGAELMGRLGPSPGAARDRFSSAYLVSAAAQTIREVAAWRERPDRLATLTLQLDVQLSGAAARRAFAEALADAVARVAARHHAPGGKARAYRILVGAYPAPDAPAAAPAQPSPQEDR
jgi:DNA-binding transcriptional ArsR family regulator